MKAIAGVLALALTALFAAKPAQANEVVGAMPVKAEVAGSCLLAFDSVSAKPVVTCVKGTTILMRSTSISLEQVTAMLASFGDPPQFDPARSYQVVTLYL